MEETQVLLPRQELEYSLRRGYEEIGAQEIDDLGCCRWGGTVEGVGR
jgi:hypothetical protein